MNKHCIICGGEFWKDHSPLPGDDRYCTACAERCCEIVEDMHAHTVVGETKEFTYPRWVWENANKLFAAGEVRRNAVTSTGLLADESRGETR